MYPGCPDNIGLHGIPETDYPLWTYEDMEYLYHRQYQRTDNNSFVLHQFNSFFIGFKLFLF